MNFQVVYFHNLFINLYPFLQVLDHPFFPPHPPIPRPISFKKRCRGDSEEEEMERAKKRHNFFNIFEDPKDEEIPSSDSNSEEENGFDIQSEVGISTNNSPQVQYESLFVPPPTLQLFPLAPEKEDEEDPSFASNSKFSEV